MGEADVELPATVTVCTSGRKMGSHEKNLLIQLKFKALSCGEK
jgi:hypothetical protein